MMCGQPTEVAVVVVDEALHPDSMPVVPDHALDDIRSCRWSPRSAQRGQRGFPGAGGAHDEQVGMDTERRTVLSRSVKIMVRRQRKAYTHSRRYSERTWRQTSRSNDGGCIHYQLTPGTTRPVSSVTPRQPCAWYCTAAVTNAVVRSG
jgi:hypothetical protein